MGGSNEIGQGFLLFLGLVIVGYVLLAVIVGPQTASKIFVGLITLIWHGLVWSIRLILLGGNALLVKREAMVTPTGERVLGPTDRDRLLVPTDNYLDYRGLATEREIIALREGDLPLGYYVSPYGEEGSPLFLPMHLLYRGCLIVGPTGSGKTESLVIPWILSLLERGASVVTVDVKGELYERLAPGVEDLGGRVWYWCCGDYRSQAWNWLENLQDGRDVEAAVQSILGRKNPYDPQPFFYERDYRWLRTLIQIAHTAYGQTGTPQQLYRLVSDREQINDLFFRLPPLRRYEYEIADLMRFPEEEYSKAVSGLLNALHLFNDTDVIRITERSDFLLDEIDDQPTLLIIGAPLADAQRSEILSSLILSHLFNVVYRRFQGREGSRGCPLFFIIDEAARLKNRIPYEEVLSVVRAAGVGICLVVQDISQFGYELEREAILANCATMILLRGCSPTTAQAFSKRLGQRQQRILIESETKGFWNILPNQRMKSVQEVTVPVLGEQEIMYPPKVCGRFCAIVQVQPISPYPFLVNLTHYDRR